MSLDGVRPTAKKISSDGLQAKSGPIDNKVKIASGLRGTKTFFIGPTTSYKKLRPTDDKLKITFKTKISVRWTTCQRLHRTVYKLTITSD